MFRTLGRLIVDPTLTNPTLEPSSQVFQIHPLQLSRWLELAWTFSKSGTIQWATLTPETPFLGDPNVVDALALPDTPVPLLTTNLASGIASTGVPPFNPALYHLPPALALRQRPPVPGPRSTVGTMTEVLNILRLMMSRLGSHRDRKSVV